MPATAEQEWDYWDSQLTTLRRTQLSSIQQAATGWRTLFGALLGIFTTVAFAGGLTTVDKLASPWNNVIKLTTLLAVLTAALATYWANHASQALSAEVSNQVDAESLQRSNAEQARASLENLRWAKIAGGIAIVIVLVGSSVMLLEPAWV